MSVSANSTKQTSRSVVRPLVQFFDNVCDLRQLVETGEFNGRICSFHEQKQLIEEQVANLALELDEFRGSASEDESHMILMLLDDENEGLILRQYEQLNKPQAETT